MVCGVCGVRCVVRAVGGIFFHSENTEVTVCGVWCVVCNTEVTVCGVWTHVAKLISSI